MTAGNRTDNRLGLAVRPVDTLAKPRDNWMVGAGFNPKMWHVFCQQKETLINKDFACPLNYHPAYQGSHKEAT